MKKIGIVFIVAGVLAATAHADELLSRFQSGLSSTRVKGDVQLNTLELVDNAHRFHCSGIAGQVLLVPELIQGQEVGPYQATLSVYVYAQEFHRTRLICRFRTAADGTFYLNLPPGTYVIILSLPQGDFALSTTPVVVTVNQRQITPIEIDVFELGGIIVL